MDRDITRVVPTAAPAPGFIGPGHTAVEVVNSSDFERNDPFIMLMDDRINLAAGQPAGGAHPHAGFEIATWLLEGELRDRDEGDLRAGDVMWTTAGSGVVHNEDVEPVGRTRILQLWMTLPSDKRWVAPRFTHMTQAVAPVRRALGVTARVYSGRSGAVDAGLHTYLPLTMVDIQLEAAAAFVHEVPETHNGFVYVLDGSVRVGTKQLEAGHVGWIGPATSDAMSLHFATDNIGARVVLYTGEKQGVPLVMHGPFVGETRADLMRVSGAYMRGELPLVSEL